MDENSQRRSISKVTFNEWNEKAKSTENKEGVGTREREIRMKMLGKDSKKSREFSEFLGECRKWARSENLGSNVCSLSCYTF